MKINHLCLTGLRTRAALRFMLSPEGAFFRDFMMDELVKSIDALSREQAIAALTVGIESGGGGDVGGWSRHVRAYPLIHGAMALCRYLCSNISQVRLYLPCFIPPTSQALGLQGAVVPVLLPGATRTFVPLAPTLTEEDRRVVDNVTKVGEWLHNTLRRKNAMRPRGVLGRTFLNCAFTPCRPRPCTRFVRPAVSPKLPIASLLDPCETSGCYY